MSTKKVFITNPNSDSTIKVTVCAVKIKESVEHTIAPGAHIKLDIEPLTDDEFARVPMTIQVEEEG